MINAAVTQHSAGLDDASAAILEQLRTSLVRVVALLESAPGPQTQPADVEEIVEALDEGKPVDRLRGKWSRALDRMPDLLRTVDAVREVGELLARLGPGSTSA